jgi:hypothetical protein
LEFFARDNNEKPVSVEIDVIDQQPVKNGLMEILDYVYCAITILGSYVTPAIPNASMSVVRFSKKQYEDDFKKEFSSNKYEDVDFTVPDDVRKNCQDALDMAKEGDDIFPSTISLAVARHLVKNKTITSDKLKQLQRYSPRKFKEGDLNSLLWGGESGRTWLQSMGNKIKEIDDKKSSYFAKDNEKKEEMSMTDEEKKAAEDAKNLAMAAPAEEKKESPDEEKKEDEKTEMAVDTKKDEKKETPEEERTETPEEEKQEEKKGVEKKFSNDVYADVPIALAFLDATDMSDQEMLAKYGTEIQMAASELKKEDKQFDFAKVFSGMVAYAKMCNAKMEKMSKDGEVYMAENAKLKKFKAEYDAKQKEFAISDTIKTLTAKFSIPQATVDDMVAEAEKVDFANIDSWKNFAKAKCVDFAVIGDSTEPKETFLRMGMPFNAKSLPAKNDIWAQ